MENLKLMDARFISFLISSLQGKIYLSTDGWSTGNCDAMTGRNAKCESIRRDERRPSRPNQSRVADLAMVCVAAGRVDRCREYK